jgi:hypothetical protein
MKPKSGNCATIEPVNNRDIRIWQPLTKYPFGFTIAIEPMVFSASRSFKTGLKGPLLSFNKT